MTPLTRREAVRRLAAASAGLALGEAAIGGQSSVMTVAGRRVEIVVSAISDATVRITALPVDAGLIPADDSLVEAAAGKSSGRRASAGRGPIRAGRLSISITSTPPAIHINTAADKPVQRLTLDHASPDISFLLGNGPLLGLGEGGAQFDRKGTLDRGRNGQGGYQLRTHGGRVPIQWLVGTDGWGMYIHQPLGAFDLTGAEGRLTPSNDGPLDVFICASSDPTVIVAEYARITGRAQLPARWTFGYMQSHRTLAGPDEVTWVARTFREKQLPCDALIYLGTEFTPSGWNTRNGEFTWKKENFPNPKAMIDQLHAQHFRVVLHVVIEGRRMTGTVHDACTPDKAVPSGRTADDQWPDDRAVACYWPYHKPVYDLGIDGWWPDQGDGLDQRSRLARIRMYWEGPQLWRPNERPFALHRNGAPGMQRFGAFLWSGDVYSTWETLKTHVPVAINTSLSGIPFWGTDIGGFVPTPEYTGELHVRWFQFGAFCPLFRAHGRTWHLRLPWGWNTGEVGPSETRGYTGGAGEPDPSELHNAAVEPIVKQYLELRYRMLPYVYSIARECCETGLPMMRALWLHHPDDPEASARGDQYLWGRDLLVSPVVEKGATSRQVYLPRGLWFDFWTEERLAGGREIDRRVDLATIPLHVRAGAVLPFGPVRQYADEATDRPLSLIVYPGADGAFTLYDDDGRSFNYQRGEWMGIDMRWRDAERRLTLHLAAGSRMLPPLQRA
ncbi:MAG: TIM-barrel domain-containing protein, partial [Vicinamibacterales bacterium]